jgi:Trypsin-like peptidase domain
MIDQQSTCVLVTVANGTRILDSGSGVVLFHRPKGDDWRTLILTCAHNLRAHRPEVDRKKVDRKTYVSQVLVNGEEAEPIRDPKLETFDLALLKVREQIGSPVCWTDMLAADSACKSHGFVAFFRREFIQESVTSKTWTNISVASADGKRIDYLELKGGTGRAKWFRKGMSGAPVYDSDNNLVAIARILESPDQEHHDSKPEKGKRRKQTRTAYAVRLTDEIISVVVEISGCEIPKRSKSATQIKSLATKSKFTREVPPPLSESIAEDDIQKGRWGGKSKNGPFELHIENVIEYARFFVFDAIVESHGEDRLVGPFVFYLHDTYSPSVIWVRKTDGKRAGLFEIGANGVYTLGVQFLTDSGWKQLEYDLADYKDGGLARKYPA